MILIVDFGSQTAHLIGRRLRQLGVTTEYTNPEETMNRVKGEGERVKDKKETKLNASRLTLDPEIKGIILSGGPASVYEDGAPTIDKKIFELGIPVLGICYGCQLIAHLLGGSVKPAKSEYGPEDITFDKQNAIFKLPEKQFSVIMSHGVTVTKLPIEYESFGHTKQVEFAAIANEKSKIYGVQFHPEAAHTEHGQEILKNFVEICEEKSNPVSLDPQKIISEIKQSVGNNKVIMAVSGGVDSTVAAFLIGKAIGPNLIPVYVDSGLMRIGTNELVTHIFKDLINADLVIRDERKRFLDNLNGITDPEIKRKTIGKLYIEIFRDVALAHPDAKFLGQGTIYSDVIESKGSKHASHIKSHHNVGGLPAELGFELIEPMRNFYKDEVREIGRLLGLPEDIVMQQPFPGPGYAVRIRGEVTKKRLEQLIIADDIVVEEVKKAGLYEKLFQCFAIMTGAFSTAVKGDGRIFAEVVAIKAYESTDVMTLKWADLPYELLQKIASRIVNEVPDVSRVVYDITNKPPATMEWE
ncbi:MAG TPA: glutamine-hydrolyzing GMP synthase [Candidatus Saccharimonadales bacterium]|nr:glutamine-hydrolyzing GMP synthase [Candidatus Saccharimonadales bacterium]